MTLREAAWSLLALVGWATDSAAGQSARTRLTMALDHAPLDRHHWGIAVLDPAGRLVFGRNADRLFMPASNTKLVVTATALAMLGRAWTVRTPVYAGGPVVGGTLAGDLILYGQGDPTWSARCFANDTTAPNACATDPLARLRPVAAALKARGITRIAGAVVGDGSAFEPVMVHPTWENDDIVWGYGAPVSGLGFNENLVTVTLEPTTDGHPAAVRVVPDLGGLTIDNQVVTTDTGGTRILWRRPDGQDVAVATGTLRQGDPPERDELAVADPNRFAALALAAVLNDSGIVVLGGVRSTTDPSATAAHRVAPPLAEIESRPLADWVFPILNVSQNWIAEMLNKQLGRQFGLGGSWREGIAVERRFLIDEVGLDSTQFMIHDGSGLSAKNAISPLAFARLLAFMRRHPEFEAFAAGLPQGGRTGTLSNRFRLGPLEGRIRAKTGSIGQVNALSGYLERDPLGPDPCRTFSVQANHHTLGGRAMIQAIDSVVVALGDLGRCTSRRSVVYTTGNLTPKRP